MQLLEISVDEATELNTVSPLFYQTPEFLHHNRDKCDELKLIKFKSKKNSFFFGFGIRGQGAYAPFSSPFSVFSPLRYNLKISEYLEAVKLLKCFIQKQSLVDFQFTLPPSFYDENLISNTFHALLENGWAVKYSDLNYQYNLKNYSADYMGEEGLSTERNQILRTCRKNLNFITPEDYSFVVCETEASRREAYEVVKRNREGKGYPLRMTYEQVLSTSLMCDGKYFILKYKEENIAAAICFKVNPRVVQVVYWGNMPRSDELRPMNLLAKNVFGYFYHRGIQFVDIGPSSESGIVNAGLCNFKQGLGCDVSNKFTLSLEK